MRDSLLIKEKLVKKSFKGSFNGFHRFMLESHYKRYQFLTKKVAAFEERIAKALVGAGDYASTPCI